MFDLSVAVGATKTIVWMFSFQLGVVCLAMAYAKRHHLPASWLAACLMVWLMLLGMADPAPHPAQYSTSCSAQSSWSRSLRRLPAVGLLGAPTYTGHCSSPHWCFFAFATWEVCGLGSTGRMLHPEQVSPIAHNLLVTQSSKLMIELVLAWTLMALSLTLGRRRVRT